MTIQTTFTGARPRSVRSAPAASPEIEDLSRPSNELTQRISPKTS
jgi:hypothetical protein